MQKTIVLYKQLGQTPLELLNHFKSTHPEYSNVKMAYAGRLDPMAHGIVLYLVGDECKQRDKYQNMDKTYEFDLILGFQTDTHDALGLITNSNPNFKIENIESRINKLLKNNIGEFEQEYPSFSSKAINGVPMYQLAKEDKLKDLPIPTKKVTIHSAELIESEEMKADELLLQIENRINKVNGDFRQSEIILGWESILGDLINSDKAISKFHIKVSASSGTYMRSLANRIGEELGSYAFAFDIFRISIGEFDLSQTDYPKAS